MSQVNISADKAQQMMAAEDVTVLDIRDAASYSMGHIETAQHVEAIDVEKFVAEEDKDKPLLVYCFHGHASQSAAVFFQEHGFNRVFSIDGGYAAWPGS